MGSEISQLRMESPLKALLKENETPLKTKTAWAFLKTIEKHCPWFLDEGLLNVPQWEHTGEELCRKNEKNTSPSWNFASLGISMILSDISKT